jgi:hypothetical protein
MDGYFPSMAEYIPLLGGLDSKKEESDSEDDEEEKKDQRVPEQPMLYQISQGGLFMPQPPPLVSGQHETSLDSEMLHLESKFGNTELAKENKPTLAYVYNIPQVTPEVPPPMVVVPPPPMLFHNQKKSSSSLLSFEEEFETEDIDSLPSPKKTFEAPSQPSFQPHQMQYEGEPLSPATNNRPTNTRKSALRARERQPSPTPENEQNRVQLQQLQQQLQSMQHGNSDSSSAVLQAISQAQNNENNDELVKVLLMEYMRQSQELRELKTLVQHLQGLVISSSLTSYVGLKDSMPNISRISNNL